ncbi:hypothetical protein [Pseudonocardia humida]|uniref:Uncharacterized protein n=1 Tax=Pseudonocardia humida TaxID=2800819 RepID=A0ABT1A6F3_9PSEU|nr:hypothetical protein [Pseudonocardia humida]MCO1658606.1 hypothetical protein [Pseudonocardia humida]
MPFLLTPRGLALLTTIAGVLSAWALVEQSQVAIPLSVAFVLAAFGWSLSRNHPVAAAPPTPTTGLCTGCRAGCVECRERIDSPA